MKDDMDIGAGKQYPASALSNFAPHPFVFRGVQCNSMEGLLQATKFSGPDMQKHVCTLIGRAAKFAGKKKNWRVTQTLYWQGQEMKRNSPEYQAFLDEAFEALSKNEGFRKALKATGNAVLTHSIGKSKPADTVLTTSEFCGRLMRLRERLNV